MSMCSAHLCERIYCNVAINRIALLNIPITDIGLFQLIVFPELAGALFVLHRFHQSKMHVPSSETMKRAGKLVALTKTGKIAPWEDWFAVKDLDGDVGLVGHMDGILELYHEGMEVAFMGRLGPNHKPHRQANPFPSHFPYKTRAAVEALAREREAEYAKDITKLGTLSLETESFYVLHAEHSIKVYDEELADWIEVQPGVCVACSVGRGC